MVCNEIRKVRANDALVQMMKSAQGCVFFTLTTPDIVDFSTIRKRWADFRHWLLRELRSSDRKRVVYYIMNYELHPQGHGWHIHSVFSCFLPIRQILIGAKKFGFGRVDIRKVDSSGVADYLTKHALKAYAMRCKSEVNVKRARMVNTSRGLPRLSDYHYQSELLDMTKTNLKTLKSYGFRPWKKLVYQCAEIGALLSVSDSQSLLTLYSCLLNSELEGFIDFLFKC